MGYPEIAWALGLALSPLLLGLGFALVAMGEPEFRGARILFLVSPIPVAIADAMWIFGTEKPLLERLLISGLIGAVALIGLTESLRWLAGVENRSSDRGGTEVPTPEKPQSPQVVTIGGSGNVTSINQTGGQTAHTIINAAPHRSIDNAAADRIAGELRKSAPHSFVVIDYTGGHDQDTHAYAQRLDGILIAGGWRRASDGIGWFLPVGGPPVVGIHYVFKTKKIPEGANVAWAALRSGGIDVRTQQTFEFDALVPSVDTVGFAIGRADQ